MQSAYGESTVCVRKPYEKDFSAAEVIFDQLAVNLDLEEPFGRIDEAISEAQGGMRKQQVA